MIFRDQLGIVCQKNGALGIYEEGGDSLAWTSHWLYLKKDLSRLMWFHTTFDAPKYPGNFVRHPSPHATAFGFGSWVGGAWTGVISRDQLTGALCYMAQCKDFKGLWNTFKAHLRRGLLFANNVITNSSDPKTAKRKLPDLTAFDIWALYIRGFRLKILYPLLILFDFHLLIDALIAKLNKDNDVINHVLKVSVARDIMPTPISWLASKINTRKDIIEKLNNYWTGFRGQYGMFELYLPLVRKYWR